MFLASDPEKYVRENQMGGKGQWKDLTKLNIFLKVFKVGKIGEQFLPITSSQVTSRWVSVVCSFYTTCGIFGMQMIDSLRLR